ncbi:MAG: phytanoyl-CoA dioxygenase family protein [Acidimicrobiia bacterium]|nr:phytanoyl-CoA dioxygenase family protein [Acidimicrobiia bacterium]
MLEATDRVLWPAKTTFQIHLTQAIAIGPGSEAQALHRDQWCFDFFPFPEDVQVEVGTIWALTRLHRGERRHPHRARQPPAGARGPRPLPPLRRDRRSRDARGSVVLYTGRTVHGGGANRTDRTRIGVNVDYVLGWLRQEENQYLACPPEVAARDLPEDLQRLAGYSFGAYALGYVDDLRDPVEVLREGGVDGDGGAAPSATGRSFAPPGT